MNRWTGELQLNMKNKTNKTIAESVFFQGAFKVMRPLYLDDSGQACYYILNPGGGYVDGDRYLISVHLQEDAELLLTTQSATKVYKTVQSPIYQENRFHLESGSVFEYWPDPLIAYQDARYEQKTTIDMSSSASLFYAETMTPGWSEEAKLFPYTLVHLKSDIYVDGKLVVLDHLRFMPQTQKIKGMGFLEGYTHFGSLMIIDPSIDLYLEELSQHLLRDYDECQIGFSRLDVSGILIRILATNTKQLEDVFKGCSTFFKRRFGRVVPELRKY
ncbi:urease accessory protein UreD [Terrilactibacillus sp. BCM23-1]|uniref:Urease accessory protein UreD n=1 Tax=Terrilactibacillus tamarindi TaxID=2599694 RepID=A0A6N8CN41_9BACI|nr:urease accessory protein UreD [Terrilactibacillus tamarindi]MTT31519.1 urease accessory protein UreD [Terrilactibacillus tamarindi]